MTQPVATPLALEHTDSKESKGEFVENASPISKSIDGDDEGHVTTKTWIVVFILSMGYGLSFWPLPVLANIGGQVAAELGEPAKVIWFIPAWTLSITVCFMIAGANTDLLGRRWFLVIGNLICTVGHIVIGSCTTANSLIAGMAIVGFGGANCQMAAFSLGELLPNKWRHIGVVLADVATFTAVIVAPVSARYGIYYGTWRWNFYAAAICQFLSFLGLLFLYFPPAHPLGIPFKQAMRELDYIGMGLFVAGATPILMALVWTSIYSGSDIHVLAPLIVGLVLLGAFCVWERYGTIKHPLTPTYVFTANRGRDFTAPCIALAVVNMFYYSSSILWPTMIAVFYTTGDGSLADFNRGVLLTLPQGFAISLGAIMLAMFGNTIKRWNYQLAFVVFIMVIFGVLMAMGTPDNMGLMIAFLFISQTAYGWAIYLSIAMSQLGVEHKNLGLSGGLSGAARFAGGSIAATVYISVLTNTVTKWTAILVPDAVIAAGLPASDVAALLAVLGTPAMSRYSAAIGAAAGNAVKGAYEKGIQLTSYTSLAFGIIGFIACILSVDIEPKMTNKIEVFMDGEEEKARNNKSMT